MAQKKKSKPVVKKSSYQKLKESLSGKVGPGVRNALQDAKMSVQEAYDDTAKGISNISGTVQRVTTPIASDVSTSFAPANQYSNNSMEYGQSTQPVQDAFATTPMPNFQQEQFINQSEQVPNFRPQTYVGPDRVKIPRGFDPLGMNNMVMKSKRPITRVIGYVKVNNKLYAKLSNGQLVPSKRT